MVAGLAMDRVHGGSTGFGEKFANDIERDVLRGPALEVLEGAQEAIKRYPFIDATRQAALGASYGGYLMNWFNGHTSQFRCLVIHAGASNNESQYGVNDGGIAREWRMGGPVWEAKGQWMDQSPFRYAAKWKTPALITQGELDFRVPINESITTFKLLQRQGVRARIVTFPDEGHWILKGENNRRHVRDPGMAADVSRAGVLVALLLTGAVTLAQQPRRLLLRFAFASRWCR